LDLRAAGIRSFSRDRIKFRRAASRSYHSLPFSETCLALDLVSKGSAIQMA